jgi:hypothetical protein
MCCAGSMQGRARDLKKWWHEPMAKCRSFHDQAASVRSSEGRPSNPASVNEAEDNEGGGLKCQLLQ